MAITYPLDLPTSIGMEQINLRAVNAVGLSESPFTFRQQVVKHQGERWEATIRIPPVKSDLADDWISFLVKLRGHYGTFLMGDPLRTEPKGTALGNPGTPQVFGGTVTGDELPIDNAPVSETGWLLSGDYIQLGAGSNSTLHRVLEDVNTNVSGEATIDIWPSITTAPADNSTVTLVNPRGRFRLKTNLSDWTINSVATYGIEFEAIGVVP